MFEPLGTSKVIQDILAGLRKPTWAADPEYPKEDVKSKGKVPSPKEDERR